MEFYSIVFLLFFFFLLLAVHTHLFTFILMQKLKYVHSYLDLFHSRLCYLPPNFVEFRFSSNVY